MRKAFSSPAMILFSLLLLLAACDKDGADEVLREPKAPVARAGNDTTIYMPFSTHDLDGHASTDPDSNVVYYRWRLITGPSSASIDNYDKIKATARELRALGQYHFELMMKDADSLSSKDTVTVTVKAPDCSPTNKDVILKDMAWNYSWVMEIDIIDVYSYLPPNSQIRGIYIKRDGSTQWEEVVPMDLNSPDYGKVPEWDYGNGVLVIFPGKNTTDDTPDIMLVYCR